jgi:hypothetical protein
MRQGMKRTDTAAYSVQILWSDVGRLKAIIESEARQRSPYWCTLYSR